MILLLCVMPAAVYLSGAALLPLAGWTVAVCLYSAFWLILALAVNSLGHSSATNAMALAGAWIASPL